MSDASPPGANPPQKYVPHWAFVIAFYVTGILWGIRHVYYWEPSSLDLLAPLGTCLVASWWAVADSKAKGHPIPLLARPLFFCFMGFLVPGYLIWSRRWYGVLLVLIHVVVWCGLANLSMFIGRMVAFGVPFGQ